MPDYDNKNNHSPWAGNPAIKEVNIVDKYGEISTYTLLHVGDYAFYGCKNLTKLTVESSLDLYGSVGKYAFYGCDIRELNIRTRSIGEYAFAENHNLTQVDINFTFLHQIYKGAFYKCDIKEILLPEVLTLVGDYAFAENTHLTKITFKDTSDVAPWYQANSVDTIGAYAFYKCDIRELELPRSVKTIGEAAFNNNQHLTKLTFINDSYDEKESRSIGRWAFAGCDIREFKIPMTLTSISDYAFTGNHNLAKVTVSDPCKLKTIGDQAFQNCSIQEFQFPKTLNAIETNAFKGNKLEKINIPAAVTGLGEGCFADNPSLKEITVEAGNEAFTSRDAYGNECNAIIAINKVNNDSTLRSGLILN